MLSQESRPVDVVPGELATSEPPADICEIRCPRKEKTTLPRASHECASPSRPHTSSADRLGAPRHREDTASDPSVRSTRSPMCKCCARTRRPSGVLNAVFGRKHLTCPHAFPPCVYLLGGGVCNGFHHCAGIPMAHLERQVVVDSVGPLEARTPVIKTQTDHLCHGVYVYVTPSGFLARQRLTPA